MASVIMSFPNKGKKRKKMETLDTHCAATTLEPATVKFREGGRAVL